MSNTIHDQHNRQRVFIRPEDMGSGVLGHPGEGTAIPPYKPGQPIVLDGGTYHVTETIVVRNAALIGCGAELRWVGKGGGPIVRLEGASTLESVVFTDAGPNGELTKLPDFNPKATCIEVLDRPDCRAIATIRNCHTGFYSIPMKFLRARHVEDPYLNCALVNMSGVYAWTWGDAVVLEPTATEYSFTDVSFTRCQEHSEYVEPRAESVGIWWNDGGMLSLQNVSLHGYGTGVMVIDCGEKVGWATLKISGGNYERLGTGIHIRHRALGHTHITGAHIGPCAVAIQADAPNPEAPPPEPGPASALNVAQCVIQHEGTGILTYNQAGRIALTANKFSPIGEAADGFVSIVNNAQGSLTMVANDCGPTNGGIARMKNVPVWAYRVDRVRLSANHIRGLQRDSGISVGDASHCNRFEVD